jgi:protein pelota
LTLKIVQIDFDGDAELIRISGTVCQENKWVKMGSHQSLEIQAPRKLILIKPRFDIMHVKKLREVTDVANKLRVGAIVMEEGMAHLFLLGKNTSSLVAKIEKRVSKKKAFSGQH